MLRALAVVIVAAVVCPAAVASSDRGFAFGRTGGNIRPYSVVISTDGVVHTTGPVAVGRTHLTRAQLGALNRLAATASFGSLAPSTSCTGALPDVASTFIRVGARIVRVHGGCLPAYQRLWKALARAVRLSA